MERKTYELTSNQEKKIVGTSPLPSDDEFKKMAKGKKSWGLIKRDWVKSNMKFNRDYQLGLWQARVDALNEMGYHEERLTPEYNLGYHTGYTGFQSDVRGWDRQTKSRFIETYGA